MRFFRAASLAIILVSLMACSAFSGVRFVPDADKETPKSKGNVASEEFHDRLADVVGQDQPTTLSSMSAWLTQSNNSSYDSRGRVKASKKEQFENALKAMHDGQNGDAERLFLLVVDDAPELSGAWLNLGQVYRRLGRLEDANRALRRALDANENNVEIYNQLAIVVREQGLFVDAEALYLTALKRWPEHADMHRNLGILYELYSGKLDKALVHYERYLQLGDGTDTAVKHWVMDLKRRQ